MAKRTAYFGVILAFALILSYVERLIPFDFAVPGIKLGLTNIAALFVLYRDGFKYALGINIARVLLANLLFGNIFSVIYALSGGILSVIAMAISKKAGVFSIIGVSMIGGTLHNIGQLAAATVVLKTPAIIYYLPILMIAGLCCGVLVGIAATMFLRHLKNARLF